MVISFIASMATSIFQTDDVHIAGGAFPLAQLDMGHGQFALRFLTFLSASLDLMQFHLLRCFERESLIRMQLMHCLTPA